MLLSSFNLIITQCLQTLSSLQLRRYILGSYSSNFNNTFLLGISIFEFSIIGNGLAIPFSSYCKPVTLWYSFVLIVIELSLVSMSALASVFSLQTSLVGLSAIHLIFSSVGASLKPF